MSIDILPAELGFRRPFSSEVAETLTIKNSTSTPVAFKVKTTAPKQYCVRPNSGRIEPDRSVEVTVLLQAMKQDPPMDHKCRDKFLVQSVPITGEIATVQEIWDSVPKSAIQEKKIRVVYLPVDGGSDYGAAVTPKRTSAPNNFPEEVTTPEANPPTYGSPSSGDSRDVNGISAVASDGKYDNLRGAELVPPNGTTSGSVVSSVAPSTLVSVPPSSSAELKGESVATLKAKLAEANALIASLQTDGGLRQRKVGSAAAAGGDEKAAHAELAQVVPRGTEGVSVQVVALLCLISFLLAYFFF